MAAFAQFGSDLDKATQQQLARGTRLTEILKQPQYSPLNVEKQIIIIFAGTNGLLDNLKIEDLEAFEKGLYDFIDSSKAELMKKIRQQKQLSDEIRAELKQAINEFKTRFKEQLEAVTA
jgi:F-type H+-transporting ATPase subunit alpha